MKKLSLTIFTFISICFTAHAQKDGCKEILMARTVTSTKTKLYSKLAWLNLVTSDNYEQMKKDYKALVPGYFDGSFSSFSQKRSQFYEEQNYQSETYESTEELTQYLPAEAIKAWRDCQLEKSGLNVWLEDIDKKGAFLKVRWTPNVGISGPLRNVEIELTGAKEISPISKIEIGTKTILLQRIANNKAIRGTINANGGSGGNFSRKIYVPTIKDQVILPEPEPITLCSCKGKGGLNGITFWGPKGQSCCGINTWGKYDQKCRKVTKIYRTKGFGGLAPTTLWGPLGEKPLPNWSAYGGNPVNISAIKIKGYQRLCFGTGKGSLLGGLGMWGPAGEDSWGVPGWGKLGGNCFTP